MREGGYVRGQKLQASAHLSEVEECTGAVIPTFWARVLMDEQQDPVSVAAFSHIFSAQLVCQCFLKLLNSPALRYFYLDRQSGAGGDGLQTDVRLLFIYDVRLAFQRICTSFAILKLRRDPVLYRSLTR